MQRADALALALAPGASWVLTSKVFEYLASGRPILAAVPQGDCRDLLQRCGGAMLSSHSDSGAIATSIRAALERGHFEVGPRDTEAVGQYAFPDLAGQIAEILDRLVAAALFATQ